MKIDNACEYIVAKHDYRNVDKIVSYEYRGKSAFAFFEKSFYLFVGIEFFRVKFVNVSRTKTEECNLRPTGKTRQYKKYGSQ